MSENTVHIVVADPNYNPTKEQKEKAEAFFLEEMLTEYCNGCGDNVENTHISLVGSDFEEITCPECNHTHDRFSGDMSDTFDEKLYENEPQNIDITMSCCGKTIKMHTLKFDDYGAFTHYSLSCLEPTGAFGYWDFSDEGVQTEEDYDDEGWEEEPMYYGMKMTQKGYDKLAEILGSPVKVIWERG